MVWRGPGDHVVSNLSGADTLFLRTSLGAWTRIELGDVGSVVDMNNRRAILSNMGELPVLITGAQQPSLVVLDPSP